MDAIRTYLDNVFAAFPQTSQVATLKAEMLADMEEKYHELKREGKSEHEAVGSVIANFGSMDEITAELGLVPPYETTEPKRGITVTRDEALEYVSLMKKSGRWIGLGVWLILTGVAAMVALNSFVTTNAAGIFVLMIFIAAAVAIFVISGSRTSRYEGYEEENVLLDPQTRMDIEQESARFMPRFAASIAGGIAAILLAVGLNVLFDEIAWASISVAQLTVSFSSGFLFIVGFAVFLFVSACYKKSAYDNLLNDEDHERRAQEEKSDRIVGTVAAVWFPAVTAAYLLWSFIADAWHISWVLWPVAGVLFGAFAGGMSVWHEGKKGR